MRHVNLDFAFRVSGIRSVKKAYSSAIGTDQSGVSRLLSGERPLTDDYLRKAGTTLRLDQVSDFSLSWFDLPPLQFESELRRLRYGWLQAEPVFEWLGALEHDECTFVSEQAVKLLLAPYRDRLGRAAPPDLEEADAEADLGRRYGILARLAAGPVLDAVRARRAAALIVHRERATQAVDLIVTDPAAQRGVIRELAALAAPEPDPELVALDGADASMQAAPCLLAGPDNGYLIDGNPGRRDVHVIVFVREALPPSLLEHPNAALSPQQTQALRYAMEKASLARHVQALRFSYEARPRMARHEG